MFVGFVALKSKWDDFKVKYRFLVTIQRIEFFFPGKINYWNGMILLINEGFNTAAWLSGAYQCLAFL
jgi:hypothetical protein